MCLSQFLVVIYNHRHIFNYSWIHCGLSDQKVEREIKNVMPQRKGCYLETDTFHWKTKLKDLASCRAVVVTLTQDVSAGVTTLSEMLWQSTRDVRQKCL